MWSIAGAITIAVAGVLIAACGGGGDHQSQPVSQRSPTFVPLLVKTGGRSRRVQIGLGTPCPGQRPPGGPTQS